MKKLILTISFLFLAYLGFSQVTNTRVVRIADATTAWGENLPKGTYIYDLTNKNLYILDAASPSTATLTTETSKTQVNATGTDDQNLTWDAVNGHIEIENGNDADIGGFGTANTNYGFVIGSNGETTKFLRGDNSWQTVLTTEVDGSVTNEGALTVTDGTDAADIVSNTSGSTNVTIAAGNAISVEGAGSTITIAYDGTAAYTRVTQWAEVAADDLTQPYPVTLAQTPHATSKITVQINGVPIKYAAGTTNGTFNFSGTALSVYANVYQYDQIEIDYEY